ncbi:TetR/AcrR family transcriptional regulator [Nocardia pneumoniae]|uniref:TetR/AcrR family transcriptional regulator n=1 Tax=Nocardia pneumoniae TaxID=228601 RepID=UPI0006885E63|nr:TetR/AcrR family transcriptional regulator C-terminal domain-containing protein [Nocardia pneumoniae]
MALSVIDETGVDGFSMRKLAAALGVDPMATYRHFSDQQDLLDAVAAAMFAELDLNDLPWHADWRELMRSYALRLRSMLDRHPKAVQVLAGRPVRNSAAIDIGNRMIASVQTAGFRPGTALQLTRSLQEYVTGHMLAKAGDIADRSRKPAPDSPDYNLLAAADDAAAGTDHFGLAVVALLDGFSRHLTSPEPARRDEKQSPSGPSVSGRPGGAGAEHGESRAAQ